MEWLDRKPCWKSGIGRSLVSDGRISCSSVLIAGERSDTGLYDLDSQASFPGFRSGTITDFFQMSGILHCTRVKLKILVRYSVALLPRCLRWRLDIPSGPMALDDLAFLIASLV